jgi:hypothetical protein
VASGFSFTRLTIKYEPHTELFRQKKQKLLKNILHHFPIEIISIILWKRTTSKSNILQKVSPIKAKGRK